MDVGAMEPIASHFPLAGPPVEARPHGSGHINDTYAVACAADGGLRHYVFQRINRDIFKDVEGLMENVARVTRHLRDVCGAGAQPSRACLALIPTVEGRTYFAGADGECWRVYDYIEDAETFDVCSGPEQAFEAAQAFGRFQRQLVNLPGGPLHETIPYFHHAPRRLAALEEACAADAAGRRAAVEEEIAFCSARRDLLARVQEGLDAGRIPQRVTHNDTKLNNVMMDCATGRALCVIDLDTVMPGSVLFDFGDMVRTFTPTAPEDEPDLSKVRMDMDIFEGLARGYIGVARDFLTAAEREELSFAGPLITLVIGIRFLTDYLAGDVYFKVHRPGHNLDRARTQFKMVREMERRQSEMAALIEKALA
jgi:hypothetical protein